jgi:hypothetical protein
MSAPWKTSWLNEVEVKNIKILVSYLRWFQPRKEKYQKDENIDTKMRTLKFPKMIRGVYLHGLKQFFYVITRTDFMIQFIKLIERKISWFYHIILKIGMRNELVVLRQYTFFKNFIVYF